VTTPDVNTAIRQLGIVAYAVAATYLLLRAGLGIAYARAGRSRSTWYSYAVSMIAFASLFVCLTLIAIAPGGSSVTDLAIAARVLALVGGVMGWVSLSLSLRGEWRREHKNTTRNGALFDPGPDREK
jgi:hypothetical protein